MLKKIIVAMMFVIIMMSSTACSSAKLAKQTTYSGSDTWVRYYVNDVEVPYEIYADYGGK